MEAIPEEASQTEITGNKPQRNAPAFTFIYHGILFVTKCNTGCLITFYFWTRYKTLACSFKTENLFMAAHKKTKEAFYSTKPPEEIGRSETWDVGLLPWVGEGASGWTEYRTRVFYLHPEITWINILWQTNPACIFLAIMGVFASNSLFFNVYLYHLQTIQSTTTAISCDKLFNDITIGSGDQTNFKYCRMGLNYNGSNWKIQPWMGLTWSSFVTIYFSYVSVIWSLIKNTIRHTISAANGAKLNRLKEPRMKYWNVCTTWHIMLYKSISLCQSNSIFDTNVLSWLPRKYKISTCVKKQYI